MYSRRLPDRLEAKLHFDDELSLSCRCADADIGMLSPSVWHANEHHAAFILPVSGFNDTFNPTSILLRIGLQGDFCMWINSRTNQQDYGSGNPGCNNGTSSQWFHYPDASPAPPPSNIFPTPPPYTPSTPSYGGGGGVQQTSFARQMATPRRASFGFVLCGFACIFFGFFGLARVMWWLVVIGLLCFVAAAFAKSYFASRYEPGVLPLPSNDGKRRLILAAGTIVVLYLFLMRSFLPFVVAHVYRIMASAPAPRKPEEVITDAVLTQDLSENVDNVHRIKLRAGTELQYVGGAQSSADGKPSAFFRLKTSDCQSQHLDCIRAVSIPNGMWQWKANRKNGSSGDVLGTMKQSTSGDNRGSDVIYLTPTP